jgi:hypothetical protein
MIGVDVLINAMLTFKKAYLAVEQTNLNENNFWRSTILHFRYTENHLVDQFALFDL